MGRFWPDASSDDAVQASETIKTVALLLMGGVERIDWLPLAYNPQGRNASELRFGLVNPDGSVRPSGEVFQQLAAATSSSVPRVLGGNGFAAIAFERADGTTVIAWSDSGQTIKAPPPAAASVLNALMQPTTWPATGLALSSSPILVHVSTAAAVAHLFPS